MNKLYWLLAVFILFSCKKKDEKVYYRQGSIKIVADQSFHNVLEELTERYVSNYPEAKFNLDFKREDSAFVDLLEGRADVAVMSRELTTDEKKLYEKMVDLDYHSDNFAGDAVLFVVPKNSPREQISVDEINQLLHSDEKLLIFEGYHTSNIYFVAQKLRLNSKDLKYSIIKGDENIIEKLDKFPNHIGVIGLNTIGRAYDPKSIALREKIKILPVVADDGQAYTPELYNIRNLKYPFARIVYFLTREKGFGLAKGFIRYSCTQKGQIVVSKQGLQPYNMYKREVRMRVE